MVFGSGGASATTVATINNAGNAQFNGTLQVGGTSTFVGTTTVKNQADAEIDQVLWAGLTTSQKESLTYKDWNGNSQWYVVKDASNNWALNSATGGLDSFKAYQSTNSGDTYVNASNASGVVRVNYETGAGAGVQDLRRQQQLTVRELYWDDLDPVSGAGGGKRTLLPADR